MRKDFVLMSRGANVLDGLEYYPDFYAHDEQLELLRFLQAQRELGSDLFGSSYAMLKNGREVIQYGVHFDFAKRQITSQRVAPVPALVVRFFARLRALGVGGLGHEFNSAIINFYYSPGAHITPHVDSLEYTTGHAVLSLQGPANIQFGSLSRARGARPIPPSRTGVYSAPFELQLMPGSLLFVAGAAATQAVHSVSVLSAGVMRVSVTGRVVPQARLDQLGIRLDVMRTLSHLDARLARRAAGGGDPGAGSVIEHSGSGSEHAASVSESASGAGSAIEHSGSVSENLHHQPSTTSTQPATASLSESASGRSSSGRGNGAGMPYHKGKGKGKGTGKGGGRGGVLAHLMQTGSDSAGVKGDNAEIDSEKQSRTTVSSSRPSLEPPVAALSSISEELAIAPTPQPPATASEPSAPTAATATPVSHVALPPPAASPLPPSAVSPTEQARAPVTESTDESADKATAPGSVKLRRSTRVIPPPKPSVPVVTTGKGQRAAKPAKAPTELKRVSERGGPWRVELVERPLQRYPSLEISEPIRLIWRQDPEGDWRPHSLIGPSALLQQCETPVNGLGAYTLQPLRELVEHEEGTFTPADVFGWYGGRVVAHAATSLEAERLAQDLVNTGNFYLLVMQVNGYRGQFVIDGAKDSVPPHCEYINTVLGTATAPNLRCTPYGKLEAIRDVPPLDLRRPLLSQSEAELSFDYDKALEFHLKVQARKEAGQARLVSSTPTMLRTPMPNDEAAQANHSDARDTAGASPSDASPPPAHGEVATRVDSAPPALDHELLEARADALWEDEMKDEQFQRELLQAKKASRADADVEMERAVEASLDHSEAVQRRFHVAQAELHGALHASRASHYAHQAAALHALVDGVRSGEACGGVADSVAGVRLAASLPATTPLADESVPVRQSRLPAPGRLSDASIACRPYEAPYDRPTEYKAIAEIVVEEVIVAVALQLALDESVAAALDSGKQSKQRLGELLFLQLSKLRPNLPAEEGTDRPTLGKVVGMLLEEDDDVIVQSIKDPAVLERRTAEAVSVFGQWWAETGAEAQVHAASSRDEDAETKSSEEPKIVLQEALATPEAADEGSAVANEGVPVDQLEELLSGTTNGPDPVPSAPSQAAVQREDNARVGKDRGNASWADLVEEDESTGAAIEESRECATCGIRKPHMPYCTQTRTYQCNEPWEGRERTCVIAHLMETGTRRVSLPWLNEEHDLRELKCLVTNNANVFSLCIARTDTKTAVILDKSCATLLPGMAWSPVVEQSKATESYAALSARSLYEPGDAGQPAGAATMLSSRQRRRAQLQSKAPGQSSFRSAAEYCQRFRSLVALEAAHELKQLKLRSMDAVDVTWESGPQQERVACFKWLGRDLFPGEQLIVQHPGKALDLRVWCGDVTADPTNPNVFSARAVVIATDSTLKGTEMPTHDFNISKAVNTVQFDRIQSALNFFEMDSSSVQSQLWGQWLDPSQTRRAVAPLAKSKLSTRVVKSLNASQLAAVELTTQSALTLINGPPGTGKTETALRVILNWIEQDVGQVLVCAASNAAVNHLASKLHSAGVRVVRYFSAAKSEDQSELEVPAEVRMDAYLPKEGHEEFRRLLRLRKDVRLAPKQDAEFKRLRKAPYLHALSQVQVVACTCSAAGDSFVGRLRYRALLVDEAGQASEPELLVPLVNGAERVVLVGDPKQLPPAIQSEPAKQAGLGVSSFQRLQQAGAPHIMLGVQYRMHPAISLFPNCQFYDSLLHDDDGDGSALWRVRNDVRFPWPDDSNPTFFWHVFEKGVEEASVDGSSSLSKSNAREVLAVGEVVDKLLANGAAQTDIAVITPYERQRQLLKRRLGKYEDMMIGNVDAIQGKESSFVILSLVRSNAAKQVGFMNQEPRVNVALTRAKHGLVIVGDAHTFSTTQPWTSMIESYQLRGLLCQGETLDHLKPLTIPAAAGDEVAFAAFAKFSRGQDSCTLSPGAAHAWPLTVEQDKYQNAHGLILASLGCACRRCVTPGRSMVRPPVTWVSHFTRRKAIVLPSVAVELSYTPQQLHDRSAGLAEVANARGSAHRFVVERVALLRAASAASAGRREEEQLEETAMPLHFDATHDTQAEWVDNEHAHELEDIFLENAESVKCHSALSTTAAAAAQRGKRGELQPKALGVDGAQAVVSVALLRLFQYWWRARVSGHLTNRNGRNDSIVYWRLARSTKVDAHATFIDFVTSRSFRRSAELREEHKVEPGTLRRFAKRTVLFRLVRFMKCGYGALACLHTRRVAGALVQERYMATKADFELQQHRARRVIKWYVKYCNALLRESPASALLMEYFAPGSLAEAARLIGFHVVGIDNGTAIHSARRWFEELVPVMYPDSPRVTCNAVDALNRDQVAQAIKDHPANVVIVGQLPSPPCRTTSTLPALQGATRSAGDVARRRPGQQGEPHEILEAALGFAQDQYKRHGIPFLAENVAGAGEVRVPHVTRHLRKAINLGHQMTDEHSAFAPSELPLYDDAVLTQAARGGVWLSEHSCTGASKFVRPIHPHGALVHTCCAGNVTVMHNTSYRVYDKQQLCRLLLIHPDHARNKTEINNMIPLLLALYFVAHVGMWASHIRQQLPMISYSTAVRDPRLGAWVGKVLDMDANRRPSVRRAVVVVQPVNLAETLVVARDQWGIVSLIEVDCDDRRGLLESIILQLKLKFGISIQETQLSFVCDVGGERDGKVDLIFLLESMLDNDARRLGRADFTDGRVQVGREPVVCVTFDAFTAQLAEGDQTRDVERYAIARALERERLADTSAQVQRVLAGQLADSPVHTLLPSSDAEVAQFRAELLEGAGFELPVPLPAHTSEVQRVRNKATKEGTPTISTTMPAMLRQVFNQPGVDGPSASTNATSNGVQTQNRRYVEACARHGVKLASGSHSAGVENGPVGSTAPQPVDVSCVGAFLHQGTRVFMVAGHTSKYSPIVAPSYDTIRSIYGAHHRTDAELEGHERPLDLQRMLEYWFGDYTNAASVQAAAARAVTAQDYKTRSILVSARSENGRMRSACVPSRRLRVRFYKVAIPQSFTWHTDREALHATPLIFANLSAEQMPSEGQLVSFTVDEAVRVLVGQGDTLYAATVQELLVPAARDGAIAAQVAALSPGEEQLRDLLSAEEMRIVEANHTIAFERRKEAEALLSSGRLEPNYADRAWARLTTGKQELADIKQQRVSALAFLQVLNFETLSHLRTGDLICCSDGENSIPQWVEVMQQGTASTFAELFNPSMGRPLDRAIFGIGQELTETEIDYHFFKLHQQRGLRLDNARWQARVGRAHGVGYFFITCVPPEAKLPGVHMQLSERRGGFDASTEFRRLSFELIVPKCNAEVARAAQRLEATVKAEAVVRRLAVELRIMLRDAQATHAVQQYDLRKAAEVNSPRDRIARHFRRFGRMLLIHRSYERERARGERRATQRRLYCLVDSMRYASAEERAQKELKRLRAAGVWRRIGGRVQRVLCTQPSTDEAVTAPQRSTQVLLNLDVSAQGIVNAGLQAHEEGQLVWVTRREGLAARDLSVESILVLTDCTSARGNFEQQQLTWQGLLPPTRYRVDDHRAEDALLSRREDWRRPSTTGVHHNPERPSVYTVCAQWSPFRATREKTAVGYDDVTQRRAWLAAGLKRIESSLEFNDIRSIAISREQLIGLEEGKSARERATLQMPNAHVQVEDFAARNPQVKVVIVQRAATSIEQHKQLARAAVVAAAKQAQDFIRKECPADTLTRTVAMAISQQLKEQLLSTIQRVHQFSPASAQVAAATGDVNSFVDISALPEFNYSSADYTAAFAAAIGEEATVQQNAAEAQRRRRQAAERELRRASELAREQHQAYLVEAYRTGELDEAMLKEASRQTMLVTHPYLAEKEALPGSTGEADPAANTAETMLGVGESGVEHVSLSNVHLRGSTRAVVSTRLGKYTPCRLSELSIVDISGVLKHNIPISQNIFDSGSGITLFGERFVNWILSAHPEAIRRVQPLPSSIRRVHGIGAANEVVMWVAGTFELGGCLVDFEDAPVLNSFDGVLLGNDFIAATRAVVEYSEDEQTGRSGTVTLRNSSLAQMSSPIPFIACDKPNIPQLEPAAAFTTSETRPTGETSETSALPAAVKRVIGEIEPLGYAPTAITVEPWCQQFIKLRVPHSIPRDRAVAVLPLEDPTQRDLGVLVAPTIEHPDSSGYITAMVINPTRSRVRIPLLTPCARFVIDPELSGPEVEFSVEEAMAKLGSIGPKAEADLEKCRKMISKRLSLFRTTLGYTHTPAVDIPTPLVDSGKLAAPADPLRVRPAHEEQVLVEATEKLYGQNIVEPAGRTPYNATPIVLHKPDGSLRPAIDFRRLNGVVEKDSFPLPNIEANLNALGKANWFTTLDLLQGFLQCELTEESKMKTAYTVGGRQWQYTRLPMGLTSSPSSFMRVVDAALRGLPPGIAFAYV